MISPGLWRRGVARLGRPGPILLALMLLPGTAVASSVRTEPGAPGELCLPAIAEAERNAALPAHVLRSIASVESGRADPATGRRVPWPWTINAAGAGHYFETRDEAIAAVRDFQARGVQSIDVGCSQVNLYHHPGAFASLEEAFDPRANTRYAARFLNALRQATGSWPLAVAGYHSMTPDLGFPYARRVLAIWPGAAQYGDLPAGHGGEPRREADYGVFTPAFAAAVRRMDADRTRQAQPLAAAGPVWIRRPPEPTPLLPPGSRRFTQRGPRTGPG